MGLAGGNQWNLEEPMPHVGQGRRGTVGAVAVAVCGGIALAGCDSSPSTGPSAHYSLTVTITAPAGVAPSVTVTGQTGYHVTLTASQTLTDLAGETYTVTAGPALAPHPVVPTLYDGAVYGGLAPSGTVVLGPVMTDTVRVSYGARPGTGALWIGSVGSPAPALLGYSAAQLRATTSAAPAITLEPVSTGTPVAVVFDARGFLWTATNQDDGVTNVGAVLGFLPGELELAAMNPGMPMTPAISLTITSGTREFLQGMAIDGGGSVWVSNSTASRIVEFTPNQFGAQVSPTPAVTLSARDGSLSGPTGLAFDARGNLWVTNANASTVVEFTTSQLATSGSPTPAVTLSSASGSLASPSGLAVDASGDLWIANAVGGTVIEFGASQRAASGAPAPIVTISSSVLSGPQGLAFDPPPPMPGVWDY
jgi:sugar lactone lactonase YvrE